MPTPKHPSIQKTAKFHPAARLCSVTSIYLMYLNTKMYLKTYLLEVQLRYWLQTANYQDFSIINSKQPALNH